MENTLATHGRWLILPQDQPMLSRVRTRYLSWDTLLEELEERRDFSGYLEVHNGLLAGRMFWQGGAQRATLMQERSARATVTDLWWRVEAADLTSVSSDVEVSVYWLPTPLAALAYECTFSDARVLEPDLTAAHSSLSESRFSGVLFAWGAAGKATEFWGQGEVLQRLGSPEDALGQLRVLEVYPAQTRSETAVVKATVPDAPPASGAPSLPNPVPEAPEYGATQLVALYNSALALSGGPAVLETAWRAAALDLSPDHPCLDPFADELRIEGNRLELLADVPFEELQPALLEAYTLTLERAAVRANMLPLDSLRDQQRGLWRVSGLERLLTPG